MVEERKKNSNKFTRLLRNSSEIRDDPTHSPLQKTAQTMGIVVRSPTRARVAPTAFRCSGLSRSARRSAIPAPSITRVLAVKAISGRLRWVSLTTVEFVEFAERSNGEAK